MYRLCFSTFLRLYLSHCNVKTNPALMEQDLQIKLFANAFYTPYTGKESGIHIDVSKRSKIVSGQMLFSNLIPNNRFAQDDTEEFNRTLEYFKEKIFIHFPNETEKRAFVIELIHLILADENVLSDTVIDFIRQIKKIDIVEQNVIYFMSFVVTVFLYVARLSFVFENAYSAKSSKEALEICKNLCPLHDVLLFEINVEDYENQNTYEIGYNQKPMQFIKTNLEKKYEYSGVQIGKNLSPFEVKRRIGEIHSVEKNPQNSKTDIKIGGNQMNIENLNKTTTNTPSSTKENPQTTQINSTFANINLGNIQEQKITNINEVKNLNI